MKELDVFITNLKSRGISAATIRSYTYAVRLYLGQFGEVSSTGLLAFKGWLVEHCKPVTANLRINGINAYLRFIGRADLTLKTAKIQHKPFLDHVISDKDYRTLKARLKEEGRMTLHFAVWTMCATGARVSELLKFEAMHYRQRHFDIRSKGGKFRRIYIPSRLCREVCSWLMKRDTPDGAVFLNRYGVPISGRGLAREIKEYAQRYGIDPAEAHPHAFRHRFALNFLAKHNDLALLADLLGHSSIETTRIYLRKTASEQAVLIDKVVDW